MEVLCCWAEVGHNVLFKRKFAFPFLNSMIRIFISRRSFEQSLTRIATYTAAAVFWTIAHWRALGYTRALGAL
jgi:hypothetical protein